MKRVLQGLVVMGFFAWAATASAAPECALCDGAVADRYPAKTSSQLTRGLSNVGFGWLELFRQPIKEMSDGGGDLMVGVSEGFRQTGARMSDGVGETLASPAGRHHGGPYPQLAHDCPLGVVGMTDR